MTDHWDSSRYTDRFNFVWQHGEDLLGWLASRPGERILDLGCGTGQLTAKLAASGADVIGVDASEEMLREARRQFPAIHFEQADARSFVFGVPFDAVFSNAALHWVKPPEQAAAAIARALRPGGRFVAEFGGRDNVRELLAVTLSVLTEAGYAAGNPWYFPSVAEYSSLLEAHRLIVTDARWFERPVQQDDPELGLRDWLRMFGGRIFAAAPVERHEALFAAIEERARPKLFREGRWVVDYRRLRVRAVKQAG